MFLLCGLGMLLQVLFTEAAVGSCLGRKGKIIKLSSNTGRIFSPLVPKDFPRGLNCTWLIIAPEGHFVKLRMKSLNLDICDSSYLSIRDGNNSFSYLLNTFSGQKFERSVFSSGRYLWVHLFSRQSKGDNEYYGFDAVFNVVKQVPAPFACTAKTSHFTLLAHSGILASYNYPLLCDDDIKCTWRFEISSDYKVELWFDSFNLSSSEDCFDDYVEIQRRKFCGSQKPSTVTIEGTDMVVTFKSSGKRKYPGFKATYETRRTTATILKLVGIFIGGLTALCICTFLCYKCIKPDTGDQTENITVVTEVQSAI